MSDDLTGGGGGGAFAAATGLFRLLFGLPLLVIAVLVIILFEVLLGKGGIVEIEPGEVAVIYNNTGLAIFGEEARTILDQGVLTFIPGLQTVQILQRRPHILVMGGAAGTEGGSDSTKPDVHRAKPLTVRANDGSNFHFDRMEIHYQIIAEQARLVIEANGPGDAYNEQLVVTHAREVLRDEFGQYSFLEIADPTSYGKATTDARRHLNEVLEPYGVTVTQIITPKPQFEARVEKAIEDRQNADQEVEVQVEKRRKLEQEAGLKVQAVEQLKNAEYQSLIAELEARTKAAQNKLLAVKREADAYFIDQVAQGRAYENEKVTRAKANEIAYRKQAEGLVAKITAVGAQGPDVLNSVIAREIMPQLKRIKATPFIKPSTPIDIRHLNRPAGG